MRTWNGTDALAHIEAGDIFAPAGGDTRRVTRLYRVLAFAVHPDRADQEGIDRDAAQRATIALNTAWERYKTPIAAPKPAAAPHVVGAHGTYLFRDQVRASATIATYLTDTDGVRLDIARTPAANDAVRTLIAITPKLDAVGLAGYVPTVLDTGTTAGRTWIAYRIPDGAHALREVRAAYPNGLDGRDWAWMARRLFMVLDTAGTAHGALDENTVFVHPEGHGIVLTGWQGEGKDNTAIAHLFDRTLDAAGGRQRHFADHLNTLNPAQALREYDTLLERLYGPRRFRLFALPAKA
jgi:hypothetical protein